MVSFRLDKSFLAFFNLRRDEKTHYLVSQAITVPASQFAVISLAFVTEKSVAYIQSFQRRIAVNFNNYNKSKAKKIFNRNCESSIFNYLYRIVAFGLSLFP